MGTDEHDAYLEQLAKRMVKGEEAAFQEFADFFGEWFRNFFVQQGMPWVQAEDMAVSCITDIALKVDKYKAQESGSFRAWVWTLARHAGADWWREYRPSLPLPDQLEPGSQTQPVPDMDIVRAVDEALTSLSDSDREIVKLRHYDNLTFAEIGDRLGIKKGTARVRGLRARRRLEKILERDTRIKRLLDRYKPSALSGVK